MRILINGFEWEILEVDSDNSKLIIDDKNCNGTCHYNKLEIYIDKNMKLSQKKNTLIHELTHAFIYSHLLEMKENYDKEEVCEFVALYGESIVNLANKYIDVKYKYIKGC